MTSAYFISDTHFGHSNIITFKNPDGSMLRPFSSVEEMDEVMIERWNKTIKPEDRVYHLGDIVIHRRSLPILNKLNGRKKLIRGNHDLFKLKDYTPYFEDIYGIYVMKEMILTHVPVHPNCLTHRFGTNVHGHLHGNRVLDKDGNIDKKYYSVCVEQIDYTPISIDVLRQKIKEQQ